MLAVGLRAAKRYNARRLTATASRCRLYLLAPTMKRIAAASSWVF
jgi:hypothetical protein